MSLPQYHRYGLNSYHLLNIPVMIPTIMWLEYELRNEEVFELQGCAGFTGAEQLQYYYIYYSILWLKQRTQHIVGFFTHSLTHI